jgi:hypothetical protein
MHLANMMGKHKSGAISQLAKLSFRAILGARGAALIMTSLLRNFIKAVSMQDSVAYILSISTTTTNTHFWCITPLSHLASCTQLICAKPW